mmetsp:Transcript_1307/g.2077  ORF Transcript_1307/g.2077 Transcript_1307/m.2077 type:complete len:335 (-) Transcript_1307:822-1826(-)
MFSNAALWVALIVSIVTLKRATGSINLDFTETIDVISFGTTSFDEDLNDTTAQRVNETILSEIECSSSSLPSNNEDVKLPPVESWPHRPIFLSAHPHVNVGGLELESPCPIGVPFEFETELFKGRALIRIRGLKNSDDPMSDDNYFSGRKRLSQFIIQGRFKKKMPVSDVQIGTEFEKPFKYAPPRFIDKIVQKALRRIAPGIEVDLASSRPRVLAPFAGTVQILSADPVGFEPSITVIDDIEERGFGMETEVRRKRFSDVRYASRHMFDTETVYTFNSFDEIFDYADYHMDLKIMNFDLTKAIGGQPFQIMAKAKSDGSYLWRFSVYNERLFL